jgi:hypothetical protein
MFADGGEPALHLCVSDATVLGQRPFRSAETADFIPPGIDTLAAPADTALISRILFDREERLWVERTLPRLGVSSDQSHGVPGATLDVLTRSGDFVGRVTLPDGLRFQDAQGDTVWAYDIGALGEVGVVAAELVLAP